MNECPYISFVPIPWFLSGYTATVQIVVPLVYRIDIPCLGMLGWYTARDLLIDRLVGSWWSICAPGGASLIGDG